MRSLKTLSSREINLVQGTPGKTHWQKTYEDRIVRNEAELEKFRNYIATNPQRWKE
jgi:hypothetical protein